MSILSNNKLKLEVKSNEAEVAKFISTQSQAELAFLPREKTSQDHMVFTSEADKSSSNIFKIAASIGTATTPLASFKYTNTDLATTAIVRGNLIIDGSALSLGTVILTDENDNTFSNIMPSSPYSNLISERYTSLLHSNISATSNTISSSINSLYRTLNANISNVFSLQRLFAGINFTSFSDTDFDNRLLTRTTDNLQNGATNTFIINKTHPSQLTVNASLNASNLITNTVNPHTLRANRLYGDGSRLANIYKGDGTTNSIIELPNASNLYYTPVRVIPMILTSNMHASNYIIATSNRIIHHNIESEHNNSNYILSASNHWFAKINTDDFSMSNKIHTETLQLYASIVNSNLYISNITASFNADTQTNINANILTLSNYVLHTSNNLAKSLFDHTLASCNVISNLDATFHADTVSTSNYLAISITNTSNVLLYNLQAIDTDTSNYMWLTSNHIQELITYAHADNSNISSNAFYILHEALHSNLLNTSNIFKYIFEDLLQNLNTETATYTDLITQTFVQLANTTQTDDINTSNYILALHSAQSNLYSISYEYSSNELNNTSNKAYDLNRHTLNKLHTQDIPDSSNYVLQTSNNIITYIYSNFMSQFADISADITAIADRVNERIDALTCDSVPQGTSKYFSSNVFKDKIRSLTLDDVKNGIQTHYITNNVYPENLTISGQLTSSNLIVSGTETVLMTNVIDSAGLEIVSASMNDALSVKQTFANKNIMEVLTDNNTAMIVSQNRVGIKTALPAYELDVTGTMKATSFIASGQYLQNVNLVDKTTADLTETTQLYYTPERAGLIVSYCNIHASNYLRDSSNAIRLLQDKLIVSESAYMTNASNAIFGFINSVDYLQSNYVLNASNQLMKLAYEKVLNQNQSNYVKQAIQNINTYMYTLDGRQSNYILATSNNLSRMLIAEDINSSNYISLSCNINLGKLAAYAFNASNYIRTSCNVLLDQLSSLRFSQSNYTAVTSNSIALQFYSYNLNMSNYAMFTSNDTSNMRVFMNINNSNHIFSTSNNLMSYISTSIANLQTNGSGNVSATATYINRWNEPNNYTTNTIATLPFNYISYNDGTGSSVGIGVTVPSATLEVYTANPALNSMKVNSSIWAQTGIIASSDARIKKDIVDIDDGSALQQILAIQPKIYNYIDSRRKAKDVYGFIAQQVAEVIPNAVRLQSQCIPDIYSYAMLYENVLMFNDDAPVLEENSKIGILCNREEYTLLIEDVYSENTFRVDNVYNLKGAVFVYGRVVNDFHTIDKDYIYTLNVCATQDLHRRQQSIFNHVNDLKTLYGYNAVNECSVKISENIDDIASIYKKHESFKVYADQLNADYMQLYDVNRSLASILDANVQSYDVDGRVSKLNDDNMKLKADNDMLASNNSNMRRMIDQMSERVVYIRGILQRNNII